MNQLQLALRRFERFELPQQGSLGPSQIDLVSSWLANEFCRVASELIERPDLRAIAKWPIQHLGKISSSPARMLVEDLENDFMASASRLLAVATSPNVRSRLAGRTDEKHFNDMLRWLTAISDGCWHGLVACNDFFWPTAGLNVTDPTFADRELVPVDLDPCKITELHTPGDFVSRCTLRRAKIWGALLEKAFATIRYFTAYYTPEEAALDMAMGKWYEPLGTLRHLCLGAEDAELRQSAISVVQLHSAWNPLADFGWVRHANRDSLLSYELRRRLEQLGDVAIAEAAATSLISLREMYQHEPDAEVSIQQAIDSHELCIIDCNGRREAWWRGELLDIDWFRRDRAWTLFVNLVELTQGVDEGNGLSISLKDARADLKHHLPKELFSLMSVARGVYRLNIERENVYLARIEADERLHVVVGA